MGIVTVPATQIITCDICHKECNVVGGVVRKMGITLTLCGAALDYLGEPAAPYEQVIILCDKCFFKIHEFLNGLEAGSGG